MFIQIADCHGDWQVIYQGNYNPRKVCCWGVREIGGKRKIVPVVHSKGGMLVDANSIGKIADIVTEPVKRMQPQPTPTPSPSPPVSSPEEMSMEEFSGGDIEDEVDLGEG